MDDGTFAHIAAIDPDQALVAFKHYLVGFAPEALQPLVSIVLTITPILLVFPLLFGLTTVIERKGLGRIQNRLGPNRVGLPFTRTRLFGFGQFIADGLKTLTKEDIVPRNADKIVHFLAPLALLVPVLLGFSVLPYGRNMVPIELDAGLLFFFAVGAGTELAVFMAGWSSRNKYSLLGAMRAIAQMLSYEIPLILSAVAVVMITGTLSTTRIVEAQLAGEGQWLANWHLFTPWGLAGFLLFLVAATAESNRSPFDIPEGESEIIAGYYIEYSGFKFALFFLGEYLGLFAMSGLAITLFLGGWAAPVSFLAFIPSWMWFFLKLFALIALFIWVRGTLPRLRMDQLMNFAWKFLLPLTLINLVNVALWHYLGGGWMGWVVCSLVIGVPYVWLGRALFAGRKLGPRTYRFAT
jgi:NADH-quinone oxidoreductase subunit H